MSAPIRDCGMDSCAIVLLRVVCSPAYVWRVLFPSYAFFGGCAPGHVIWEHKSVDSQVGVLWGAVFGTDGAASAGEASLLHLARACGVSYCNMLYCAVA